MTQPCIDALIDDARVNDIPPKDRDIAMVFQNYALYPHMSVFDNMAFGLELRRYPKPEIKKRVLEAAGILGIEQFLSRRPKALSGGQRHAQETAASSASPLHYVEIAARGGAAIAVFGQTNHGPGPTLVRGDRVG